MRPGVIQRSIWAHLGARAANSLQPPGLLVSQPAELSLRFFPRRPPSWQRAEPAYVNLTHCGNQSSPSSDSADPKSIHFTRSLNSLLADESREAQCEVSVARQGDVERGRVARFRVNGSKAAQLLLSLRCASILARSGNRKENTSWHEQIHPPNPMRNIFIR